MSALRNVPWIESPVEEIWLTLPDPTCCRNVGLYGIWTREAGFSACEEIQKLSASTPSTTSTTSHLDVALFGGLGAAPFPTAAVGGRGYAPAGQA